MIIVDVVAAIIATDFEYSSSDDLLRDIMMTALFVIFLDFFLLMLNFRDFLTKQLPLVRLNFQVA